MNRGGRLVAVLLVAAWVLTGPAAAAVAAASLEFAVKANYLVRFAAFVDWPAAAFDRPDSPMVVCVVGRDPFGAALDQAAAGQVAHGRPMVVRRSATGAGVDDCRIVYLGAGTPEAVADRLEGARSVLVVTDGGEGRGGVIQFVLVDNRVRFRIDQAAASRAGLNIGSRLLNLAVSVEGRG